MSALQTDVIATLRPRTVGEIIDAAFRLYRGNFRTFLLIVALVYLPVRLLSFGADVFLLGTFTPSGPEISLVATDVAGQLGTLKGYIDDYLTYFAQWALALVVANLLLGRATGLKEAYRQVWQHAGSVVGLIAVQIVIAMLILTAPLALLVAVAGAGNPGRAGDQVILLSTFLSLVYAIILVRLQVVVPAAAIEELSPGEALSRSWDLTLNYWWRTLAVSLVLGLLGAILVFVSGTVIAGIAIAALRVNHYTGLAIQQAVGMLITILYAPIEIVAVALYYFDQRIRKESFDLDSAIANRYENGEALDPLYEQDPANYEPTQVPAPPKGMGVSPGVAIDASVNYGLGQDCDQYPLLPARQSGDAMRAIRRRAAREAEAKRHTLSAGTDTIKRKRDTHSSLEPNREDEQ